jgi:hypothetical protein
MYVAVSFVASMLRIQKVLKSMHVLQINFESDDIWLIGAMLSNLVDRH